MSKNKSYIDPLTANIETAYIDPITGDIATIGGQVIAYNSQMIEQIVLDSETGNIDANSLSINGESVVNDITITSKDGTIIINSKQKDADGNIIIDASSQGGGGDLKEYARLDGATFTGEVDVPYVDFNHATIGDGSKAVNIDSMADALDGYFKKGDIDFEIADVLQILHKKANLNSPYFTGNPQAPTKRIGDSTNSLATTLYADGAFFESTDGSWGYKMASDGYTHQWFKALPNSLEKLFPLSDVKQTLTAHVTDTTGNQKVGYNRLTSKSITLVGDNPNSYAAVSVYNKRDSGTAAYDELYRANGLNNIDLRNLMNNDHVIYENGIYLMTIRGSNLCVMYSYDSENWFQSQFDVITSTPLNLKLINGIWFLTTTGGAGLYISYDNGLSFKRTLPGISFGTPYYQGNGGRNLQIDASLILVNDVLYIGTTTGIWYSDFSDLQNWTQIKNTSTYVVNSLNYLDNKLWVMTDVNSYYSSDLGATWNTPIYALNNKPQYRGYTDINGVLVLYSTNGIWYFDVGSMSYKQVPSTNGRDVRYIVKGQDALGKDLWIACKNDGLISSTDGINWTFVNAGVSASFRDGIFWPEKQIWVFNTENAANFGSYIVHCDINLTLLEAVNPKVTDNVYLLENGCTFQLLNNSLYVYNASNGDVNARATYISTDGINYIAASYARTKSYSKFKPSPDGKFLIWPASTNVVYSSIATPTSVTVCSAPLNAGEWQVHNVNGIMIALSSNNVGMYWSATPNTNSWVKCAPATDNTFDSAKSYFKIGTINNALYIACSDGNIYYTNDGKTIYMCNIPDEVRLNGGAYYNNQQLGHECLAQDKVTNRYSIITAQMGLIYSDDGVNWLSSNAVGQLGQHIFYNKYNNKITILNQSTQWGIYESNNGGEYISAQLDPARTLPFNQIFKTNEGTYLMTTINASGRILISFDSISWFTANLPYNYNQTCWIQGYLDNRLYIIEACQNNDNRSDHAMYTSDGGLTIKQVLFGNNSYFEGLYTKGIIKKDSTYYAITQFNSSQNNPTLHTSLNGINFTAVGTNIYKLSVANGRFFVWKNDNTFSWSDDLVTFYRCNVPGDIRYSNIQYIPDSKTWFAMKNDCINGGGYNIGMMISTDNGENWNNIGGYNTWSVHNRVVSNGNGQVIGIFRLETGNVYRRFYYSGRGGADGTWDGGAINANIFNGNNLFQNIIFHNNQWVAFTSNPGNLVRIATSYNLQIWSTITFTGVNFAVANNEYIPFMQIVNGLLFVITPYNSNINKSSVMAFDPSTQYQTYTFADIPYTSVANWISSPPNILYINGYYVVNTSNGVYYNKAAGNINPLDDIATGWKQSVNTAGYNINSMDTDGTIIVATFNNGGVYVSNDNGITFNRITQFGANPNMYKNYMIQYVKNINPQYNIWVLTSQQSTVDGKIGDGVSISKGVDTQTDPIYMTFTSTNITTGFFGPIGYNDTRFIVSGFSIDFTNPGGLYYSDVTQKDEYYYSKSQGFFNTKFTPPLFLPNDSVALTTEQYINLMDGQFNDNLSIVPDVKNLPILSSKPNVYSIWNQTSESWIDDPIKKVEYIAEQLQSNIDDYITYTSPLYYNDLTPTQQDELMSFLQQSKSLLDNVTVDTQIPQLSSDMVKTLG